MAVRGIGQVEWSQIIDVFAMFQPLATAGTAPRGPCVLPRPQQPEEQYKDRFLPPQSSPEVQNIRLA
jgi:hypothetical protein